MPSTGCLLQTHKQLPKNTSPQRTLLFGQEGGENVFQSSVGLPHILNSLPPNQPPQGIFCSQSSQQLEKRNIACSSGILAKCFVVSWTRRRVSSSRMWGRWRGRRHRCLSHSGVRRAVAELGPVSARGLDAKKHGRVLGAACLVVGGQR